MDWGALISTLVGALIATTTVVVLDQARHRRRAQAACRLAFATMISVTSAIAVMTEDGADASQPRFPPPIPREVLTALAEALSPSEWGTIAIASEALRELGEEANEARRMQERGLDRESALKPPQAFAAHVGARFEDAQEVLRRFR